MKKNPGRKERRRVAHSKRKVEGRKKMRIQQWREKKDKQLESKL